MVQSTNCLTVTVGGQGGLSPFQGKQQWSFSWTHIDIFVFTTVIAACSLAMRWLHDGTPSAVSTAVGPCNQPAISNLPSWMLHAITVRRLPCIAMDLSFAETTTSASQLEAQLQAAPTQQLQNLSGFRHGQMAGNVLMIPHADTQAQTACDWPCPEATYGNDHKLVYKTGCY
jgi:hypothetical protein